MGQPTIYDVARAAGVAPSTVSRTFSRPGRVNSATAERVRQVADELGYRANPLARALSTTRTRMIALLISDITNPFGFEIIRGAEQAAAEAEYTMILSDTQESDRMERQALERALPFVDGFVLATSRLSDSAIRMTVKQKPLVVLNRAVVDVPSVVTDNAGGARQALRHLIELGHRRVCYVAGPEASYANGIRWRTILETAQDAGVKVKHLGPFAPTVAAGVEAATSVRASRSSAAVAFNDQLAIGLMRGSIRLGASIPADLSIVGFDDILPAHLVSPELTTVAAPLRAMGAIAVQNLLASLGGAEHRSTGPVILPTRLVVRDSTASRDRGATKPPAAR